MNKLSAFFILPLFLFAGINDFSAFDKFDRMDKQEFNRLKKEVKKCINNWNFDCARDKLYKMKRYITSKKDNQIISSLWNKFYEEKRAKERYEKENEEIKANSSKYVYISDCYDGADGARCCSLYINGEKEGTFCYQWNSSYKHYDIFSLFGANFSVRGYYAPSLHMIWTTKCGDSSAGSVYSVSEAVREYANCVANGHY